MSDQYIKKEKAMLKAPGTPRRPRFEIETERDRALLSGIVDRYITSHKGIRDSKVLGALCITDQLDRIEMLSSTAAYEEPIIIEDRQAEGVVRALKHVRVEQVEPYSVLATSLLYMLYEAA